MARRSSKIRKIVALTESEERQTGQATGRSRLHLEEERQKLGELNAYRHNYASRRERPGNVSSVHWQDYQNFLARLDGAVRSQQQVVRDCQEKLEVHRRRWMARRQRLESLERVLQRFEDEERQQAERRQQRQVDDRPRNRSRYEGG